MRKTGDRPRSTVGQSPTEVKVCISFLTYILGITTLVRDPREHLYNAQRTVPDCVRCGACICVALAQATAQASTLSGLELNTVALVAPKLELAPLAFKPDREPAAARVRTWLGGNAGSQD